MRRFQDAVRRRSVGREPVAYITGVKGFRHLDLARRPARAHPAPGDRDARRGGARAAAGRARGRRRHRQRRGGAGAQARAPRPRGDGDRRQRGRARRGARQRGAARARRRASCAPTCSTAWASVDAVVSNPPYVEDGAAAGARDRAPRAGAGAVRGARRAGRGPPAGGAGRRARRRLPRGRGGRRPGAGRRGARARGRASRAPSAAPTSPGIERVVVGVALSAADAADLRALHRGRRRRRVPGRHGLRAGLRARRQGGRPAPVHAQAPPARQARRGHVLRRSSSRSAALPELGPRTARALRGAAARRRDAAAAQPGGPLPAGVRRRSGDARACGCRRGRRRWRRWPTSAGRSCSPAPTSPGGPDARRARGRARVHARRTPTSSSTAASCPGTPSTVVDLRDYEADERRGRSRAKAPCPSRGRRAARVRAVTTSAFVTGGSGFIGGALVRRLVADGWTVRALARSDASADAVRERGAEPVRGDLDDVAAMTAGAAGLRGRLPLRRASRRLGHARGLRARQRAGHAQRAGRRARQAGVRRFVHVGTEAALLAGEPLVEVDERAPLRFDSPALYSSTKARAEEAVIEANRDGLETVVVRPRFVWGRGDTTLLPAMTEMVRARALRVDRRRPAPHVDHARRQRRRRAAARRRARRARRRLLRHRRRARGLPRVRHPPARHAGRRRRRTGRCPRRSPNALATAGGDRVARCSRSRPAAADAPGGVAVRAGDDDRHHTRAHRARLRAGQDHRRGDGGAEAAMRIAVGSDHAGFHLKEHVKQALAATGPRRRRRRNRLVARRRLPALRRARPRASSARARSPAPSWPAARASAWRSSPTRSTASAPSTPTTRRRPRWPAATTTSTS